MADKKILDLLDQLEQAIPDIRDQLGGAEPDGDESELPPVEGSPEEEGAESPDEESAEGDEGAADLSMPPMLKKKKPPFLA